MKQNEKDASRSAFKMNKRTFQEDDLVIVCSKVPMFVFVDARSENIQINPGQIGIVILQQTLMIDVIRKSGFQTLLLT